MKSIHQLQRFGKYTFMVFFCVTILEDFGKVKGKLFTYFLTISDDNELTCFQE